jgi:hypothetical protein
MYFAAARSIEERELRAHLNADLRKPSGLDLIAWVGSLEPLEDDIDSAAAEIGRALTDAEDSEWCETWRAELVRLLAEV